MSIHKTKDKEIKLTLQITKIINVDCNTSINDIKKIAQNQFGLFENNLNLFVKDYEVTNVENVNLIRTLEYYKSNTVLVIAQNERNGILSKNEDLNTSRVNDNFLNLSIANESQLLNNSNTNIGSLKDKINDAYQSLNNLKKNLNSYSLNNSKVNILNSPSNQFNHSMFNYSGIGLREETFENSAKKANLNINTSMSALNAKKERHFPSFKKYNSNLESNLNFNYNQINSRYENFQDKEFIKKEIDLPLKNKEIKNKQSFNNGDNVVLQEDYKMLREEVENIYRTNQILNKSNMDLKQQLKNYEENLEINSELREKINQMNEIINSMKQEMLNSDRTSNEIANLYEELQFKYSDLLNENRKLQNNVENVNANLSMHERTNLELKNGIESVEDILKSYDNEKSILNLHLNEKDKKINELNDKLNMKEELNEKTRKNIQDYEEMMASMKKTIEILKKSSNECENEIFKLKVNLEEKENEIGEQEKLINEKDKIISQINEEIYLMKNDINFLNNEIVNKENEIEEVVRKNFSSISEIEKYKLKTENLNKVIDDKDKTIDNLKSGYNLLNSTLEEMKIENENLKRKAESEYFEKNKNIKIKETIDNLENELRIKSEELQKLKESYQRNLIIHETEINEFKHKINNCQIDITNLENILSQKEEFIISLQSSLDKANSQIEQMNILHQEISELNLMLEKETQDLKLTINNFTTEIKNLTHLKNSQEEKYNNLVLEKESLEDEIFSFKDKISKTESDVIIINDKYLRQINELNNTINNFKSENLNLVEENKRREKTNSTLTNKNSELEELLKNLKINAEKTKNTYEHTLQEMKKNLTKSNEQEDKLISEKKQLNEIIKIKENEIENLEICLKEKEECEIYYKLKEEEYQLKINKISEKNESLESHVVILNERITTLQNKINENSNLIEDINKKYQDLLRNNNKLNSENIMYKENYEKLNLDFIQTIQEYKTNTENNYQTSDQISLNNNSQKTISNMILNTSNSEEINTQNKYQENTKTKNTNSKFKSSNPLTTNSNLQNTKIENKYTYLNTQHVKRTNSIKIIEGNKFIYRIYDKKRILRFDLENREFQIIEFADFGYFEENYNSEGSIFLNVLNGLFIVTGDNHDMLYFFSHAKKTMNKLCKLNDNHSHGALIQDRNELICLSGWHNKKVEKYSNKELINKLNLQEEETNSISTKQLTNSWSYLPEMSVERSESSYLIMNNSTLYAFFGYCCPKMKYLDTIESLNLVNSNCTWQNLKFSNEGHITTFIKSHSLVKVNEKEVLIVGGYDGSKMTPLENFIEFNLSDFSITKKERKLADIVYNHFYNFQKDSMFVSYVDVGSKMFYAGFDEMDIVHVIDPKCLQYDVFKFD